MKVLSTKTYPRVDWPHTNIQFNQALSESALFHTQVNSDFVAEKTKTAGLSARAPIEGGATRGSPASTREIVPWTKTAAHKQSKGNRGTFPGQSALGVRLEGEHLAAQSAFTHGHHSLF